MEFTFKYVGKTRKRKQTILKNMNNKILSVTMLKHQRGQEVLGQCERDGIPFRTQVSRKPTQRRQQLNKLG